MMSVEYRAFNTRFLPKAKIMKALTLGFDRVLADMFWLLFLQYYGDRSIKDNLKTAPAYLELITTLDPHFIDPYWFTAFAIAGDMGQVEQADKILAKGVKENPLDWSIAYIAGFSYFIYKHDEERAANYFRIAASVKGAPSWLNNLAVVMGSHVSLKVRDKRLLTLEKSYETAPATARPELARQLQKTWSDVYYSAPNENWKQRALEKLEKYGVSLLPPDEQRQ